MRAHHVGVVRVPHREQHVEHLFLGQPVRSVLDALAALVAHDVLLVRQHAVVESVEQESHAVALEPQRELELVRGHVLQVVRAVEVGGAVDERRAGALEVGEVAVGRQVAGALEHHVLEQVREPGAPGGLVRGTDVVPDVHRHERQAAVLAQDDVEPVRQRVFLVVQPHGRDSSGTRLGTEAARQRGERGGQQHPGQSEERERGAASRRGRGGRCAMHELLLSGWRSSGPSSVIAAPVAFKRAATNPGKRRTSAEGFESPVPVPEGRGRARVRCVRGAREPGTAERDWMQRAEPGWRSERASRAPCPALPVRDRRERSPGCSHLAPLSPSGQVPRGARDRDRASRARRSG